MRGTQACLAGMLIVSVPAAAAADIGDYLGKPVTSVRLAADGRDTTDPKLLQMIETRVGRPLAMLDVRESIAHLFSMGRFEDVTVHADVAGIGVALRYELALAHPIERVVFAGTLDAPGIDQNGLREAVVNRFGAAATAARTADMAAFIRDQLAERGYLRAQVTARPDLKHPPQGGALVFALDVGTRTSISAIDIIGSPGTSRTELLKRLDLSIGASLRARGAEPTERAVHPGPPERGLLRGAPDDQDRAPGRGPRRPGDAHAGARPARARRVQRGPASGGPARRARAGRA